MAALVSWKNMKLRSKLMFAFLVVGLVPFAINGFMAITQTTAALEAAANDKLDSIRQLKQDQIFGYMQETQSDLGVLGFSSIDDALPVASNSTTPYRSGSLT